MKASSYPPLNLIPGHLKFQKKGEQVEVFDVFRKKWLVLTPEEWVRQHLCHYLVEHKGYPKDLISMEQGLTIAKNNYRADVVVYQDRKPFMVIECKAPHINLSQDTVDQITRYNLHFNVPHLLISNGMKHLHFRREDDSWNLVGEILPFKEL